MSVPQCLRSAKWESRVSTAPRPGAVPRGRALRKTCRRPPRRTQRRLRSQGASAPPAPHLGPRVREPCGRAASHGRPPLPPAPAGLPPRGRASPLGRPLPANVAAPGPYRDPRPGRRARSTQAVPGAPRPRVRARAGCPPRSRGRLGHGPAPPGPRRASPRRRRRAQPHAGPAPWAGWQCGAAWPHPSCATVGPRPARGCARLAGAGGGGGVGARLCGLRPGGELGPSVLRSPPARSPAPSGRRCDPGCGPGPGCELRGRPGASSAGELHRSCHVATNCILGGMSLSGVSRGALGGSSEAAGTQTAPSTAGRSEQ